MSSRAFALCVRTLGLILTVACFSGPLYSQSSRPRLFENPKFLNCSVCGSGLFQPVAGAGLKEETVPAPSTGFGSSFFHFPNSGHGMFRMRLGDRLTGFGAPAGSRLLRDRFRLWDPADAGLPPRNTPDPLQIQKSEKANSVSGTAGSPGHIFWVIPAFKVVYGEKFRPLTPKEKFEEWARGSYDPMGLTVGAFEAGTLEYSSTDGFCGYGQGWGGYGECFGSLELDATDSSFIGDFVLPVVLHQDPRFFRLDRGSFGKRVWYSVSRVFVTYNDSGHTVFYSSALSGTVIAALLSNFYYPSQDVGVSHTMTRIAIDLGNTALYNLAAEFWPNIDREVHRTF